MDADDDDDEEVPEVEADDGNTHTTGNTNTSGEEDIEEGEQDPLLSAVQQSMLEAEKRGEVNWNSTDDEDEEADIE